MKHKHVKSIAEFIAEKNELADLSKIKKGALHKQLGYPEGEVIPVKELNKIIKAELDSTVKINGKEHKVTELLKKRAVDFSGNKEKVNEGFGLNNSKIEDLVKALKKLELPVKSIGDTLSGNVFGTKLKGNGHLFNIKVSKPGYEILDVNSDDKYPKNVVKEFSNKELNMLLKYVEKTYGNGRQIKESYEKSNKVANLKRELSQILTNDFSYDMSFETKYGTSDFTFEIKNEYLDSDLATPFSLKVSIDSDNAILRYFQLKTQNDNVISLNNLDKDAFLRKFYMNIFTTEYHAVLDREKLMVDTKLLFDVIENMFVDVNESIDNVADISFDGKNVTYIKNDFEITGTMRKYNSGRSDEYEFEPDSFEGETEEYFDRNWENISAEIVDVYNDELGKRYKRNVSESKETINPNVLHKLTKMHRELLDIYQTTKISRGGFNPSKEFGGLRDVLDNIRKTTQNVGIKIESLVSLLKLVDEITNTRDIERAGEIKKRIHQLFPKVSDEIKKSIDNDTKVNESFGKEDELVDELGKELKKLDLPVRAISSNVQNDVFGTKIGSIKPLFSISVHSNGYEVIDVDSDVRYPKNVLKEFKITELKGLLGYIMKTYGKVDEKMGPVFKHKKADVDKKDEDNDDTKSRKRCVEVTFTNGDSLTTEINGTVDEIKKYYIGKTFNMGHNGDDLMTKGKSVKFLK